MPVYTLFMLTKQCKGRRSIYKLIHTLKSDSQLLTPIIN